MAKPRFLSAHEITGRITVTVPKLSSAQLVARANKKLKLTHLDEAGYAGYDFLKDAAGKTYEVLTWSPGRCVDTDEVRKHFAALEADGNTAAFITWVTEKNPAGWWISIPSDDSLLFRFPKSGDLFAPSFYRFDDGRELGLVHVDDEWHGNDSFVAFREVTST